MEPVAVAQLVLADLGEDTGEVVLVFGYHISIFYATSYRLVSQGFSLKLVNVQLEAGVEIELSFAESFDDADAQS